MTEVAHRRPGRPPGKKNAATLLRESQVAQTQAIAMEAEEQKLRGESELERLREEHFALMAQSELLRDTRDELSAKVDSLAAECASLRAQLAEAAAGGNIEPPFDENRSYEMRADFNAIVGYGQHLSYAKGFIVSDPYILRLLHANGAKMKAVY